MGLEPTTAWTTTTLADPIACAKTCRLAGNLTAGRDLKAGTDARGFAAITARSGTSGDQRLNGPTRQLDARHVDPRISRLSLRAEVGRHASSIGGPLPLQHPATAVASSGMSMSPGYINGQFYTPG